MFETRVLSGSNRIDIHRKLRDMGCQERGVEIMGPKAIHRSVYARNLDPRAANIVKQEFLATGGEAAVPWKALDLSEDNSEIIMMGTLTQFNIALKKLDEQPFKLPILADEVRDALKHYDAKPISPWGGRSGTQIMGIINVTPDSFYDGGEAFEAQDAVDKGIEYEKQGADILDIGGESTRPGSQRVAVEDEINRVVPVIEGLSSSVDIPISIDTHKPEVAKAAVEAGASVLNDVYGLREKGMLEAAAELNIPVIIMHMQGTPETMQDDPHYEDVVRGVYAFLLERTEAAIKEGVDPKNIVIDPGIGFGKTIEHNLELIDRIDEFRSMGYPVLLGASRKSMFGDILGKDVEHRLYGSLAAAAIGVDRGVSVIRVHDVEETVDVIRTLVALKKHGNY